MSSGVTETEKYRTTFTSPSVSPLESPIDGTGSSGSSTSSTKFFRVRQLSSNSSVQDGGHMLDCRLGTDEQTGRQQVEMIFSLNPAEISEGGLQSTVAGSDFSRGITIPPEPILTKSGDFYSDESPVFTTQHPLLSKTSAFNQGDRSASNPGISPSETFSISGLSKEGSIKKRLQGVKHLVVGVSEKLELQKDNRAFILIYLILLAACVIHSTVSRMLDLSPVTTVSLFVLLIGILDFYSEQILKQISNLDVLQKREKWNTKDEEHFDSICRTLAYTETRLQQTCHDLNVYRLSKSKMVYVNGILGLLFFAWLGTALDGIIIMYLLGSVAVGAIQMEYRQKSHQI